jgi:ATP-binding cassette subfamily B protein
MTMGPPAGSPFSGPSGVQSSQSAGLPFAGIPPELAARATEILESEPTHPEPVVEFSQSRWDRRPFTLRSFLRPHLGALLLALALVVVETVAGLAGPVLTKVGIDQGIDEGDRQVLYLIGAVYLIVIAINVLTARVRIAFTSALGEKLMYELRIRLFSHFQRLSIDFYTDEKAGRLMSRMTSDIEALTMLFQEGIVNMFVQVLTLTIIIVVLLTVNASLALVLILAVVPVMLLMTLWFRAASDRGYTAVRDRIADVLADLSESLAGIRIIAAYNRRRHNVIHHRNVVGEHLDANLYTARVGAIYGPGTEALGIIGQGVILVVGGRMVLDGTLTLGDLTLFVLYLTYFFAPIQQLVQLYNTYQQGQAAITKLRDVLATEPSVLEQPDALELPPVAGRIELDGVSFGYLPGREVLHDVTFTIEPGETIAFVGTTGAGKSTIAKLITRFYDPTVGAVRIDGHDLRAVTLHSLRTQLGIVPQEPFLFHGSIRDNVTFARPDAAEDEIMDAIAAVGLDDLIERLPAGLDTPCHERGSSLSSGERQLLALARAFLARPRVLVLDEATSNLDLRSETKIEHALDRLLQGRTAVLIAHRLATAMRADRIAVIEGGRLVEMGTHDELVARGEHYAELHATWLRQSTSHDAAAG